ncbi:MAG: SBBP repeat-containing protein [Flavobacteriales bacterium]|nr:SBBP repeat-containing protein [Flavobacteriales bacterium]
MKNFILFITIFVCLTALKAQQTCNTAVNITPASSCNYSSHTTTGTEYWLKFVATSPTVNISLVTVKFGINATHIHNLSLYSGNCSIPILVADDELPFIADAKELAIDLNASGLVIGQTYYLKASRLATHTNCDKSGCTNNGSSDPTVFDVCVQDINVIIPKDFGLELPNPNHSYTTNRGQLVDLNGNLLPEIKLYNDKTNPAIFIAEDKVSYVFAKIDTVLATPDTLHRVDMSLVGSNTNIKPFKTEQRDGYTNYFLAHIPDGVVNNKSYSRVVCNEVYNNIDLQYYSNKDGLKYYFIVKPGGDPDDVILKFDGATAINVTPSGGLEISTSIGLLDFEPPHAYLINPAGNVVPMPWQAKFEAVTGTSNQIKFKIHNYNPIMPLFIQVDRGHNQQQSLQGIDNLEWSTFYGGNNSEFLHEVHTTSTGYTYFSGESKATDFPVTPGVYQGNLSANTDAVIIKIRNSNLDNTWATYYGGTTTDIGKSIAIDNNENVFVIGSTNSPDFPVLNPIQSYLGGLDGFAFRLNSTGTTRAWATTFGGSQSEYFNEIALDNIGNIYAVGRKFGGTGYSIPTFPQTGATTYTIGEGVIVKFSTTGSLLWATQFGNKFGCDIRGIAVDNTNNFFITGFTNGGNGFVETNPNFSSVAKGASEAFITKFDVANNIVWSSYISGNDEEAANDVSVNSNGNVVVIGTSKSTSGFPTLNPIPTGASMGGGPYAGDAFLVAFSGNGTQLFGTYLGGNDDDEGFGVSYANNGYIYATGTSYSTNNVWLSPSANLAGTFTQSNNNLGNNDVFIAAFDNNFNRVWGTFFGGSRIDEGNAIAVDNVNNKLYVTGWTNSPGDGIILGGGVAPRFPLSDFILGTSYYQDKVNLNNNVLLGGDGFIARFDLAPLVSIEELLDDGSTIGVYPNPSSDLFNLNIKLTNTKKSIVITVYDLIGKVV